MRFRRTQSGSVGGDRTAICWLPAGEDSGPKLPQQELPFSEELVATFDFAFVEPRGTFAVADEQYIVIFAVMLLTALVISTLTDRMRKQSELARQAWERVETGGQFIDLRPISFSGAQEAGASPLLLPIDF